MRYIIGIDIGTTNTKAVAFTEKGEVLGGADVSYPVVSDADGRYELDALLLLEAVTEVLRKLGGVMSASARWPDAVTPVGDGLKGAWPADLAGISLSCAMHSLIAVDGQGVPITRAMTWADLRPAAQAEALKGTDRGRRIYEHTGTPVHAMSPLCKLLWLREAEPDVFRRAARFISIKEYIWQRWFGVYQVDYSIASATGLFDIRKLEWYPAALELAGIDAGRLSEPVPCTHVLRGIPDALSDLGMPAELSFVIGGSDGCMANLGSGAIQEGETALTIGTSGAIRMTAPSPKYDVQERIFSYILTPQHYVCGGATNNGGNVLQWYIQQVLGQERGGDTERWVREAAEVEPGSSGLVFLPYLQGERAPVWDAHARGVFFGVRSVHGQRHFIRAILEGVCFEMRQIGVSLEETLGPIKHIYASGGFTKSKDWLQLMADVFMKTVYVTGKADASAVGAAMLALYALGIVPDWKSVAALSGVSERYEPDALRHEVYLSNYKVFTELYSRLKDLM